MIRRKQGREKAPLPLDVTRFCIVPIPAPLMNEVHTWTQKAAFLLIIIFKYCILSGEKLLRVG